jgi:hypothetical protein
MPQGDKDQHRQQEIDNDEEEDKGFNPEGGRNHHNTRSAGQPYNIHPRGQQRPITPDARVLQPTAFAATPTTSPAASAPAYSGLDKMLTRGGARQETTKTTTELKWQATIAKDKDKIKKFLENVLQVQGFHAFLFMTKDSCFVRMAHSVAKFATVNPIAGEVVVKIFGFIGDRRMDQEPRAVLIPTNAWMAWANHKVGGDAKAMTDHYHDKATMASSTKSRG